MSQIVGHISQVIGPVVDVYFEGTEAELMLPSIHDALEIRKNHGKRLIVEVQQHIGENTMRCVAMDTTDGLRRGMKVIDLQRSLAMPTGTYCGVTLVIIWSVPMKKLNPFGWKFNPHPNDVPKLLIA